MNAFDSAKLIDGRSLAILGPFLEEKAYRGRFVMCTKGRLADLIQSSMGDALFNSDPDTVWSVELKADNTSHPNLFLETFSNKNLDDAANHAGRGSKPGWLVTQGADLLLYHRLQYDELLVIPLFPLKRWAFGCCDDDGRIKPGRIYAYPERRQAKFNQLNDTWGRCVPIADIEREVGFRRLRLLQGTLWDQGKVA